MSSLHGDLKDTRALAHKLYTQCRESPSLYKSLSSGLRKLRNVLEEVEDAFEEDQPIGPEEIRVITRVTSGRETLRKLDLALQHYRCSTDKQQTPSAKAVQEFQTFIEVCINEVSQAFDALESIGEIPMRLGEPMNSTGRSSSLNSALTSESTSPTSYTRGHKPSIASIGWSSVADDDRSNRGLAMDKSITNSSIGLEILPSDEKETYQAHSDSFHTPVSSSSGPSPDWRSPFAIMDPLSVSLEVASSMILGSDTTTPHLPRASISSVRSAASTAYDDAPTTQTELDQVQAYHSFEDHAPRLPPIANLEFSHDDHKEPEIIGDNTTANELPKTGEEDTELEKLHEPVDTPATERGPILDSTQSEDVGSPTSNSDIVTETKDHDELETKHSKPEPVEKIDSHQQLSSFGQFDTHSNPASLGEGPKAPLNLAVPSNNGSDTTTTHVAEKVNAQPPSIDSDSKAELTGPENDVNSIQQGLDLCLRKSVSVGNFDIPKEHKTHSRNVSGSSLSTKPTIFPPPAPAPRRLSQPDQPSRRPPPPPPPPPKDVAPNTEAADVPTISTQNADSADDKVPEIRKSTESNEDLYTTSRPSSPARLTALSPIPASLRPRSKSVEIPRVMIDDSACDVPGSGENHSGTKLRRSTIVHTDKHRRLSHNIIRNKSVAEPTIASPNDKEVEMVDRYPVPVKNSDLEVKRTSSAAAPEKFPTSLTWQRRSRIRSDLNSAQVREFYGEQLHSHDPDSDAAFDFDKERMDHIVNYWNAGDWNQAKLYLEGHHERFTELGNVEGARRVRHLLGVCHSFKGDFRRAIPYFLSVLKAPIKDISELDAGDFAAAYWLGDCYAMLNKRTEALLAYLIAERGPVYQDHEQPHFHACIKAEQACVQVGVSKADFMWHWANADKNNAVPDSILDTKIISMSAAKMILENEPRRMSDQQVASLLDPVRSRGYVLTCLRLPNSPAVAFRDYSIQASTFDSKSEWPLQYDPFFAMGNVSRGRLLAYECDLLEVFAAHKQAKPPKTGPVGLSRMDCFAANDLSWLIKTLRECLIHLRMAWSEVANVAGTWLLVRYPVKLRKIVATHYTAISIFKQSFRSGYGVEICPDGVWAGRIMVINNPDYLESVHDGEVKRVRKMVREYLENAAKDAKSKRKSSLSSNTTTSLPDSANNNAGTNAPNQSHENLAHAPESNPVHYNVWTNEEPVPPLPPRPSKEGEGRNEGKAALIGVGGTAVAVGATAVLLTSLGLSN